MINPNIDDLSITTFLGGCQTVHPEPTPYEEVEVPLKAQV